MKAFLMRCALAIAALMPAMPPAAAWTCADYANLMTKGANAIRDMGGCGFDLKNWRYSTNSGDHYRWCREMENIAPEQLERELEDTTEQAAKCAYCNKYARLMSDAGRDNIAHGCGFDPTDNYWNPDRNFHFKGCMAYGNYTPCIRWMGACIAPSTLGEGSYFVTALDSNVGYVFQRIAECKLRHPEPKGCMSGCHGGSQTPAALLPAALRPVKRDSGERNVSIGRVPPSFKRDGTSSGDSDKAQPSGARQRTPSGSSNSAMDRLGGAGGGSAASTDRQSGSTQRPSSGGGTSSSSPSGGGSAPAIGTNTITNPGRMFPGQTPGLR